MQLFLLNELMW